MAYLGKTPSQAVRSRYYYTATGGETSLSGADDNSNVLTFTDGNYVDVSLNGVALVAGTDYNTTTTNTIAGLTALVASDVVEVIVYDTFSVFGGNMAANLNFKDNVKANFGTGNDLQIFHDGSNSIIRDAGTGSLKFQYGTSDGVVFDSSGNVGIGTASPSRQLEIYDDGTNGQAVLAITAQNTENSRIMFADPDDNNIGIIDYNHSDDSMRFFVNNAERMRIDSSGNVGIGVIPEAWNSAFPSVLQIGAGMALTTSGGDNARIFGNVYYDGSYKRITSGFAHQYEQTGGTHRWYYAATGAADSTISFSEAMRIDSSGNLLVGTTSTSPGLGNTNTGIQFQQSGVGVLSMSNEPTLYVNRNGTDGTIAQFRKDGTTVGSIASTTRGGATDIFIGSGDTGIYFTQALDAVAPSNQGSDRDAAIDLGRSANRFKDLYLSGGVYLGGTGAANHLDDYEEGSWTPVDYYGAVSFTVYEAYYTKIGRKVFFELGILIASNSSGNDLRISGLPFTALSGNENTGGAFVIGTNASRTDLFIVSRGTNFLGASNNSNADVYFSSYSNKQLKLNGSYIAA